MKQTRILMGMPITLEIVDAAANNEVFAQVYAYFDYIDQKFSTYKKTSEITLINQGKILPQNYSHDMKTILSLARLTKRETNGYFDITHNGKIDPSGLVKGWAINEAAKLLQKLGFRDFYVEAGGDIQTEGRNKVGNPWRVAIRNPLNTREIIKVLHLSGQGIATSGTYERGDHIYNPKGNNQPLREIVSLTVIGPNVYEADRFATAAFAMEKNGIAFIEKVRGLEGYLIDKNGFATYTSGFNQYTRNYEKN